uniref:STML2-like C-terminal extension domain-containing protein n=1 Tax=Theileria annulata TaxID=5874 RepID=A0A3B0MQV9_THEAN
MRSELGKLSLDSTFLERDNLNHLIVNAEAERMKRAEILRSEGDRESEINIALAKRQIEILKAEGEAKAEKQRAEAAAYTLEVLTNTLKKNGKSRTVNKRVAEAVTLRLAEKYIAAFANLAKTNNTIILSNNNATTDLITQATTIFGRINSQLKEDVKNTLGSVENTEDLLVAPKSQDK